MLLEGSVSAPPTHYTIACTRRRRTTANKQLQLVKVSSAAVSSYSPSSSASSASGAIPRRSEVTGLLSVLLAQQLDNVPSVPPLSPAPSLFDRRHLEFVGLTVRLFRANKS